LPRATEIDRLIEEGLSLYGAGNLDGAIVAWERVLALDPRHVQANSYIEYVRANYQSLSDGRPAAANEHNSAPFPVHEEPEYQIEIEPGEQLPPATPAKPPVQLDPRDEGWPVEEETRGRETSQHEEPSEFDSATREYQGGFPPEGTPVGFATQQTDVRKRDLGFVQPAGPDPGEGVQVRIRTPEKPPAPPAEKSAPTPTMALGKAPTLEAAGLDLGEAGRDPHREPTARGDETPAFQPDPPAFEDPDDLLDSLPSAPKPVRDTKELPGHARLPADRSARTTIDPAAVSQAEVVLSSAPTRELGTRPAGRPPTSDDSPTHEADVRAFRDHHSAQQAAATREIPKLEPSAPPARPVTESTRKDVVLAFDPIDARSAQILDEIDVDAPPSESPDDRTRRRISTLFDRSLAWNGIAEYEKAVTAVELALSEDPASALAQKLIHRNRDTIMMVFQNYLGELDRQPQLAKPLHELAGIPISPRAAFLLSRIDGTLTIDEVLDVSGMPRMEAYRYLCQLFLRGVLK
jgi:tetratricopeptide (TPR) repeat protein